MLLLFIIQKIISFLKDNKRLYTMNFWLTNKKPREIKVFCHTFFLPDNSLLPYFINTKDKKGLE